MSSEADAAMAAIEKALRKPRFPQLERLRWRIADWFARLRGEDVVERTLRSRLKREALRNLAVLRTHLVEGREDYPGAKAAMADIAGMMGFDLVPDEDLWGDDDPPLRLDENQLDAAAAYARRGQFADALHHLERALPDGFGDIAERIARHLERTSP